MLADEFATGIASIPLACVFAAVVANRHGSKSMSLQVVLAPTDDTYVQSDNPNARHGGEPPLEIRYRLQQSRSWFSHALFKFNVSSIPQNATVIRANLNFTVDKLSTKLDIGIFVATFHEWNETSIAWNSQEYASLEKALAPVSSAEGTIGEAATYSFDVSDDVRSAVVNGTLTEVIKPLGIPEVTGTARVTVHSKETANENARPKLLVTYEVPLSTTTEPTQGIFDQRTNLVQLMALPAVVVALVAGMVSLLLMARRSPPAASLAGRSWSPTASGSSRPRTGPYGQGTVRPSPQWWLAS